MCLLTLVGLREKTTPLCCFIDWFGTGGCLTALNHLSPPGSLFSWPAAFCPCNLHLKPVAQRWWHHPRTADYPPPTQVAHANTSRCGCHRPHRPLLFQARGFYSLSLRKVVFTNNSFLFTQPWIFGNICIFPSYQSSTFSQCRLSTPWHCSDHYKWEKSSLHEISATGSVCINFC